MSLATVIIHSHNRLSYLKKCLESVREYTSDYLYELIVVDHISTDGSREYLKEQGDIQLYLDDTPKENFVYARSANYFLRLAKGDYVYLLNDDCEVTPRWLSAAVRCAEADPRIGHVVSKVLWPNSTIQSAGRLMNPDGTYVVVNNLLPHSDPRGNIPYNCDYGWGLFLKKLLVECGGFSEDYTPMYFEDNDWGIKVRLAGYDVRYCPDSVVYHYDAVQQRSDKIGIYSQKNLGVYQSKWHKYQAISTLPTTVQIESTTRCNLSCSMCQRFHFGITFEDMAFETFVEIVGRLPEFVKNVDLTGWGEPLLHPKIFEMVRHIKKVSPDRRVSLTTNGFLLTPSRQEELISCGLDSLRISIDSLGMDHSGGFCHPENSKLTEMIRTLLSKARSLQVVFNTVIYKDSLQEILGVIEFAGGVGVRQVDLLRLDIRFAKGEARPSQAEEKVMFHKAKELGDKLGVKIMLNAYTNPAWVSDDLCPQTHKYLYIDRKGNVTPCCALPTYAVGNILKEKLEDIWHGGKLWKFRRDQEKICGECDVLKRKYFDKEKHERCQE